jgi:hypothetical protein
MGSEGNFFVNQQKKYCLTLLHLNCYSYFPDSYNSYAIIHYVLNFLVRNFCCQKSLEMFATCITHGKAGEGIRKTSAW